MKLETVMQDLVYKLRLSSEFLTVKYSSFRVGVKHCDADSGS